jgi:signal peptidase I
MMGKKIVKIIILVLVILIILFAAARLAGYRAMRYPADVGNSMYPTIAPGDSWLCKMGGDYTAEDLKPGMVILFPKEGYTFLLTKRIIAVENQAVTVKGRETFVNGERIEEPYAFFSGEKPSGMNVPHTASEVEAMKVPEGKLFVMGDNRDNSFDSRDPKFGFVDVGEVAGEPILVLWAKDKSRIGCSTQYLKAR